MFRPVVLSLSKQTSSTITRVARQQALLSTSSILREVAQDDVRSKLKSALKTAMKAKEKDTAGTIRVRGHMMDTGRESPARPCNDEVLRLDIFEFI